MRKVSKLGIYLPSILLIIALIIVFTAPKKDKKDTAQLVKTVTPTATITPAKKININLRGPFVCGYVENGATISAAIKNKQIVADFIEATQSSHFVVKGDCVYMWDTKKTYGDKYCGVGTAIDTVDFISSMGLLDIGSIMSALPMGPQGGVQESIATNEAGIQKFMESCIKKEPAKEAFDLPNMQFLVPTTAPTPGL